MKTIILDDWEKYMAHHPLLKELKDISEVEVYTDKPSQEQLFSRIKDADIVIPIRERTIFNKALIDAAPHLKMIAQTGTGTSHIDMAAVNNAAIAIATTPGGSTASVTELTFAFMLNLIKKVSRSDYSIRNNDWPEIIGTNVQGKTLGIIGLGKIGCSVSMVAKAFGMKVITWGPTSNKEKAVKEGIQFFPLDDVLKKADIISIHVRLVPETTRLLGEHHFNLMKKSALIINTSRGDILDEDALIKALRQGDIAGAGLDVFSEEPLPENSPIRHLNNVLLTPHIGWKTQETFDNFLSGTIDNIKAFFIDKTPQNIINQKYLNE